MMPRILASRLVVAVIALLGAGLIIGTAFLIRHELIMYASVPYIHESKVDYAQAVSYWEQQIRQNGSTSASAMFTKEGNALATGEAHTLAHAFGGALYHVLGVDGLGVCDINFNYGCYHEFVGSAIIDKGLNSLSTLHDACFGPELDYGKTGGCLHGLGHGVLGYLGYSPSDLKQALNICGSLNGGKKDSNCTDGVYMEYNLRILASAGLESTSSELFDPRPLTEESRYEPCASLDSAYRPGCIFELPIWWFRTTSAVPAYDRTVLYGNYCSVYSNQSERFACFRGIGYMVAGGVNLKSEAARRYCDASSSERSDRVYCYTGIVLRLRSSRVTGFDAVCDSFDLNASDAAFCHAYVRTDIRTHF